VPIIFAVAFLSLPQFIGQLLSQSATGTAQHIGTKLVAWFTSPTAASVQAGGYQFYIYPVLYFLLVFMFTFFYTNVVFNAKEIAENLQKQGAFIDGVRPGAQTEKYLLKTVNRVTFFGALALGFLAVMPIIVQTFLQSNRIAVGGTSVLILVAVALETLRQLESRALMVTYDDYTINIDSEDDKPKKQRRKLSLRRKQPKAA
jgi:preprotein translocase subunit SecY